MGLTIKDYQDWLKNNKQAKVPKEGETLSAFDEQENRALYNQYLKEAELLRQRRDAEARLSEQKASALRDNYVQQAQAQKKAEDAVKMQGMASGVSESGLIDLYAQGAATRAGIIKANDSSKNDVFSAYRQALIDSKAQTNETIANIGVKRAEKEETDLANKKTQTKATFKNMLDGVLSGTNSKDELVNYYNQNSEYIDDEYLTSLYNNIDDIKADKDVKAALESYGKTNDFDALKETIEGAGDYLNAEDRRAYETIARAYEKAETEKEKARVETELQNALTNYGNGLLTFEELTKKFDNYKTTAGDELNEELIALYNSAVSKHNEDEEAKQITQDSISFESDIELLEEGEISLLELIERSTNYSLSKETEKELCNLAWKACTSGDKDAKKIVNRLAAAQRLSKSERTRYLNAIPKEDE